MEKRIFSIDDECKFIELALEIFRIQYESNEVYNQFVNLLHINPSRVKTLDEIPFLPISFFKTNVIKTGTFKEEIIFTSSGTTGPNTSRHFIKRISLYEKSFMDSFRFFFGNPADYVILALLPSYLEREGSSLIFMVDQLIRMTKSSQSGFYLDEYELLLQNLEQLKNGNKKVMLIGVTYALLELTYRHHIHFPELIVMETGGMKGRHREIVRDELHAILKNAFGVRQIYSEYGMTEMLSQAYSKGEGIFETPPWLKILIRDTNDPLSYLPHGQTGGINMIDLANLDSCAFIATQDLGKTHLNSKFEVVGRFDNSDIRGCNLLIN